MLKLKFLIPLITIFSFTITSFAENGTNAEEALLKVFFIGKILKNKGNSESLKQPLTFTQLRHRGWENLKRETELKASECLGDLEYTWWNKTNGVLKKEK